MVFLTEEETMRFAADFAQTLKKGDVVLLRGDLGAGKSIFARSVIRALAGDPELEVPSPTFTLVQTYDTPKGDIWHFDLYRLKEPEEIFELGWEDALAGGIILVEWPERLGRHIPKNVIEIQILVGQNDAREIKVNSPSPLAGEG